MKTIVTTTIENFVIFDSSSPSKQLIYYNTGTLEFELQIYDVLHQLQANANSGKHTLRTRLTHEGDI